MRLTDLEEEHLKALIDAGEPLPARYRASLFAQPHEAELIWPEKNSPRGRGRRANASG